ncbi:winged helix-turn-helix domain-containing protein [Thiothrix fructosivorans]|uniref:Winged helix-turn-helix domain-containing protein n=1 Tax=Thiothrix fructosivorans TaxID=111770 RepID=A0A8B0SML2_9GAMM|nr:winged helix-turn-helix domain-containing protein [Thiothrix fructosivorans]MBO0612398.1 winged helix-turn-helix domain-containing protein [Thiothrix fructosivorans]QTX12119.1 winged helix-turn-helix domain-containing protein [Thiothrix fructosivorans]
MPDLMQFDPANQSLHSVNGAIQLPPKAFAILDYLHQRPHQLVSKEELLSAVWPGLFVTDAVLKVAIADLRKILIDDPKQPRYIETVHRRGYRFVGELPLLEAVALQQLTPIISLPQIRETLFGRQQAFAHLQQDWDATQQGQRHIAFLQGEAGFGKTTLLSCWLAQQQANPETVHMIKVQCLDQYGQSEAYQPFIDVMGYLLESSHQTYVKQLLKKYAPTWLIQLPIRYQEQECGVLKQELFGATQGRVLREFADFIENLSQYLPHLLVIEDLHWCDTASIELLAVLAYRTSLARLMVVGSFRPSEVEQGQPRLKSLIGELMLKGKCRTIVLGTLDRSALQSFLFSRLTPNLHHDWLVELFVRYTEGNPLFVYTALEHVQQNLVDIDDVQAEWLENCISGGLKTLLELKIMSLDSTELTLLQASSIAINQITAEGIAAILEQDVLGVEDCCTRLLLKAFWLTLQGEQHWPDGSICESYRFRHQLYREFFYTRLSAARRRHYHLRLAKRLLAAYQGQTEQIATKLAYHFEAGGDVQQSITFRRQACAIASQRFAYAEAIQHMEKLLHLLRAHSYDTRSLLNITEQYCTLLLASGRLMDAITAYQQLATACQQPHASDIQVRALLGLAGAFFWIDRKQCLQYAQQAVQISQYCSSPNLHIHARGKQAHWQAIIEGYRQEHAAAYDAALGMAQQTDDLNLKCTHHLLYIYYLIIRAEYAQACDFALTTQALAKAAGDGNNYLAGVFFHAWALFYRGQWGEMLTVIEQALQWVDKNDYPFWKVHFLLQHAWLLAQVGDYSMATALSQPIYSQTCQLPKKSSAYFFSLTILLQIATGQHHWETAQGYVDEITTCLAQDAQAMDWILKLPLQQALTEYWLEIGAWQQAVASAQQLQVLAAQSGERTYLLLAYTFMAHAQQAQQQPIQTSIAAAEALLETPEPSVSAWRFHALQQQTQQAQQQLQRLLESLESYPALQRSFANVATVQNIFTHVSNGSVCVDA